MNIHEYQAKSLLKKYGVAVPRGGVAYTPQEAEGVARELGGPVWVVKSQIHAGGRGAGHFKDNPSGKGGVRVVKSIEEVGRNTLEMLGHVLVTKQTGPEGKEVKRVYIEEGCDIKRELYLSMLVDRGTSRVTIIASTEGGMAIEDVAEATPEKIMSLAIDPATGIQQYHARKIAFGLGLEGKQIQVATKFLIAMYKAFTDLDAAMLEINPLVVTGEGQVIALDAKMGFDDNALFRHKDIEELRDESEEDPAEIEANRHSLSYVKLDGTIGCMVNGAGLAMATMDLIKFAGGKPANFLDVGGSATAEKIAAGFKILVSDPGVKAILVNIFGGIMNCATIAEGILSALGENPITIPLVVRMEGTNVEEGRRILAESGLTLINAADLADAAKKVAELVA